MFVHCRRSMEVVGGSCCFLLLLTRPSTLRFTASPDVRRSRSPKPTPTRLRKSVRSQNASAPDYHLTYLLESRGPKSVVIKVQGCGSAPSILSAVAFYRSSPAARSLAHKKNGILRAATLCNLHQYDRTVRCIHMYAPAGAAERHERPMTFNAADIGGMSNE